MNPMKIVVSVIDASRALLKVEADFPVQPGSIAKFVTPLWLPESHVQNGPVGAVAGLYFSANSQSLSWKRDPSAAYIYEVTVPEGISSIHASFESVLQDFVTRRMIILKWETVLMHPADISVRELRVGASIMFPAGWSYATALEDDGVKNVVHGNTSTTVEFADVTVDHLQDSPILVGQNLNQISITPDNRHLLCLVCSDKKGTGIPASTVAKFRRLVNEIYTVFGALPYRKFRFLVMISDYLVPAGLATGGGMEHAESCFIVTSSKFFSNPDLQDYDGDIFSHEFSHAWNGKYRRPEGHVPYFFSTPLQGTLMWVYEGLTQYYGYVLAVRSGFMLPSTFRRKIAETVSQMGNQAGRVWSSTEDTATVNPLGIGLGKTKPRQWSNWLRGADYYYEGVLLWLDVDTIIREKTNGRKSLDDFAREFYHKRSDDGDVDVVAYTQHEVEATLSSVAEYDWAAFFNKHVQEVEPHINVDGVERAGYKFEYSPEPELYQKSEEGQIEAILNSLGVKVTKDGNVDDVRRFSPSDDAKLAPGQVMTHVQDEQFSVEALWDLVRVSTETNQTTSVRLQHYEDIFDVTIKYNGGLRYPKLSRQQDG